MDDAAKTIHLLIESERLADKILQNKQGIVFYDKRRQQTREAIRELGRNEEKKTWITIGSMLVEMKKDKAMELLQKGETYQAAINYISAVINSIYSMWRTRDLEFADPLKGFDLNPLSRDEIGVLRTNLPGF